MKKSALHLALTAAYMLAVTHNSTAQNKVQDHNSSRSNKSGNKSSVQDHNSSRSNKSSSISLPDGWSFGTAAGSSFALKSSEATMFRCNSIASKMFGRYNFGAVGLGFNTGFVPGSINSNTLNTFLTERKFPADAIINSTKPLNAYLLLGPSFNFGRRVNISADVSGGMFYNNTGGVTISQQGATRALYRFDAGSKNLFPGFAGSINIAYPLNNSTRFFINTDYLQTTSSIRLLDPQRGIDIATEQNRAVKLFTAGVGIIKSFSTQRDVASGLATGRRSASRDVASGLPTGKRSSSAAPRDAASGLATGRRNAPRDPASGQATGKRILSPRDPASGLATGKRSATAPRDAASGLATGKRSSTDDNINENCGPVTLKKTNPDGSTEENTFSCPADAANYAKQTQGATFGEKVNQGLHAAGSKAATGNNIIAGFISWGGGGSGGIVTNKTKLAGGGSGAAAASYASTGLVVNNPGGVSTAIHTRDAASGLPTGKRSSRDAVSGLPTGRSQYQPVFFEGENNDCTGCNVKVNNNPLFESSGVGGNNPLHKSNGSCTGVKGIKIFLVGVGDRAIVASTTTEDCGEFYFANVPDGNYAVTVSGSITANKTYNVTLNEKGSYDVAGEILLADDFWTIEIITATGTPEDAAAVIKTKTKSNQSNDRLINTTRSNIKNLIVSTADTDDDGETEIWVGNELPGGAIIGAAMRPGTPIGGIIVKGGKNPGGQMRSSNTNEFGEFEFNGLEEGSYSITAELKYVIADETVISVGDDYAGNNINTTASNLKDISPAADKGDDENPQERAGISTSRSNIRNKSANSNMPNRISMNVTVPKQTQGTTFGEKVSSGMQQAGMRAQNNNTVRSNRTDNAIVIADLDGDGEMESSVLDFNSEVATITTNNTEAAAKVVEKATSGLKDNIKTQVRMAANNGPVKWVAKDKATIHVHGDPHVDEKDGTLRFDGSNTPIAKNSWKTTAVAVKAITCADGTCAVITGKPDDYPASSRISLNGLPPGTPVAGAAVWFSDNKGNTYTGETDNNGRILLNGLPPGTPVRMYMNMRCDGTDDILVTFTTDAQGNAISNVLKTKHDTAKNAIGNIR